MARLRYNGLSATLGAALAAGDTTITFAAALTSAAGAVPTLGAGDTIALSILDASGGVAEIVSLTAYTSGATTGTITRAQESTTAAAHASGAAVVHAPTAADFTSTSGAGRVLLASRTLVSAAANIAFTSSDIPTSGYNHLELLLVGRSTKAAVGDEVNLSVNGDTTAANYKLQRIYGASAASGASTSASFRVGFVEAASDPAGSASSVRLNVLDYLGSWHKVIQSQGGKLGDPLVEVVLSRWTNTAAITSLTLTCTGGNFAAGSKAWLYGLQ